MSFWQPSLYHWALGTKKVCKSLPSGNVLEGAIELSKEQKNYIEDFLQNKTGTESLAIGEEREFSKNLIEDAVESAQKLSDEQLKRIELFSALAPNLILKRLKIKLKININKKRADFLSSFFDGFKNIIVSLIFSK